MNTIREAINAGSRVIQTNNNTIIRIPYTGHGLDEIQPPKMIDGKPVYRKIFCLIHPSKRTKDLDSLKKYLMGEPFREDEYIIPEREMNLFINQNGGINEYATMFWVNQYDY